MKKANLKIYWRDTGAARRAYGDFRAWSDVGGGREPLKAEGSALATTDPDEAKALYLTRAAELNEKRLRNRVLAQELGVEAPAMLESFAAHHLLEKARAGSVTEQWLAVSEQQLRVAIEFFGADRELHTIRVPDVQRFANHLSRQPVRRGRKRKPGEPPKPTLSPGSVRKYLNTLSNLFRRAQSEGRVPVGHNPVAAMIEKPRAARKEARWLEVPDAALLLEAARTWKPKRDDIALPFAYPLIATLLLTGGRESEVLGLEVEDVSFDRGIITFRPNQWRRLKTDGSHRTIPLWPQLEEILREYLYGGFTPRVSGLLFPSHRSKATAMLTDWRKSLDAIAERAGWKAGEIRSKAFRHTYTAARLQTLDNGAPVSIYTVARELGHSSDSMVRRVYGHLGNIRHRAEVVEYRVEQHRTILADRLALL